MRPPAREQICAGLVQCRATGTLSSPWRSAVAYAPHTPITNSLFRSRFVRLVAISATIRGASATRMQMRNGKWGKRNKIAKRNQNATAQAGCR